MEECQSRRERFVAVTSPPSSTGLSILVTSNPEGTDRVQSLERSSRKRAPKALTKVLSVLGDSHASSGSTIYMLSVIAKQALPQLLPYSRN